jgi:hypothetical protein
MGKTIKPIPAALGFRVKSGWAMAVLLAGSSDAPKLVKCQVALLSDPKIPESKQPYHAALELPKSEGKAVTQKLRRVVKAAAERSVKDLLKEARAAGYEVVGAALVVGSMVDPTFLHNEHIQAHGFEGQLFRTILEDAFRAHGISCATFLEKNAYAAAATALDKTVAETKRTIADLGDSHEGSWRSEEKLAALAAWVALTSNS